jgi:hypothetical protein
MTMKKNKNLTVMMFVMLVLSFAGCSGSSGSDDKNAVPEEIYSATGEWTTNAVYAGDQNDQCSVILGHSNQDVVTIEGSGDTYTITFSNNGYSVTATRQGNTFTYSGPVYIETEQIGTVDGKINITSDSTFEGTLTFNIATQAITCQAVYNITGNKNPSD